MTAITWNWARLQGSALALKFARRDLPQLDAVVRLVPQRRVVLQAGGSLGVWPKRLAQSFASVITCEPDAKNFARLQRNAREPNIRAYPFALGDHDGTVGICRQRRDGKPKTHDGCPHVDGPGTVPMRTIDSLALPICDLISLDVEGYELFALRGAVETLRRCRPVVVAELNQHLGEYGCRAEEVLALMAAEGYRVGPRFGVDQVWMPQALEAVA